MPGDDRGRGSGHAFAKSRSRGPQSRGAFSSLWFCAHYPWYCYSSPLLPWPAYWLCYAFVQQCLRLCSSHELCTYWKSSQLPIVYIHQEDYEHTGNSYGAGENRAASLEMNRSRGVSNFVCRSRQVPQSRSAAVAECFVCPAVAKCSGGGGGGGGRRSRCGDDRSRGRGHAVAKCGSREVQQSRSAFSSLWSCAHYPWYCYSSPLLPWPAYWLCYAFVQQCLRLCSSHELCTYWKSSQLPIVYIHQEDYEHTGNSYGAGENRAASLEMNRSRGVSNFVCRSRQVPQSRSAAVAECFVCPAVAKCSGGGGGGGGRRSRCGDDRSRGRGHAVAKCRSRGVPFARAAG